MNFLPRSRHLQIFVVTGSLLFVFWLSATMLIDAYKKRDLVQNFQRANADQQIIFKLASALAEERRLAYILFNSDEIDQSGIDKLQSLTSKTDTLAKENEATFLMMDAVAQRRATNGHGHGHQHGHATHPMQHNSSEDDAQDTREHAAHSTTDTDATSVDTTDSGRMSVSTTLDHETTAQHHESGLEKSGSEAQQIIQRLRHINKKLYHQLMLERGARQPGYGMMVFHEYSSTITAIDGIRQSLRIMSGQSLPENYVITRLKDSFWVFRESVSQISALLEGVALMVENSQGDVQTGHHADMLTELNVRVDMSWNDLAKVISSSSDSEIAENAKAIDSWYKTNFRVKSIALAAPSQFNTVSLTALQDWLKSAQQLTARAEDIRTRTNEMKAELISTAEHRTTIDLIQVSFLVLATLFMALASALSFQRVDRQAYQDELTGLDNRRLFSINLARALGGPESKAGILMIDLDRFKQINDTMGHEAGDRLLQQVSQRIAAVGTACSSISRLGGDEFAMLFKGHQTGEMENVAKSVRRSLIDPFDINGATLNIGSSIGMATYPGDAQKPDSLLRAADLAMYCAKKSGTNQITVYDSQIDQSMAIAARTVTELQIALKNNELELYYQPQYNLAQAKVLSAEALIRWNHPQHGFLTPNHFISIAEENGLMPAIGNWVIEEACRQAANWLYKLKTPLRVAVNISADHFFQPDFVQNIVDSLERHKLPPHLLEVEVTESVAMNDIKLVVESLRQLRELSVHVALDDFGTGYSSLSYLQELPLDTLKIDKSFIQNMLHGNSRQDSITQTIVALGKTLELETVAEGVETMDQLAAVSDMKISVVQGYYYSKPVSAGEFEFVVRQLNNLDHSDKAA